MAIFSGKESVTCTPSEVEANVKNLLPFNIMKGRLAGPDGLESPEYGLWRDDTWEYVSTRSVRKGFVTHQTTDVATIAAAAAKGFDCEVTVHTGFKQGHYVSIFPTKEHRKSVYGTEDNVWPRFHISAPLGGGSYNTSLGFFRDCCTNMAMLSQVGGTKMSIRHDRNLPEKVDELVDRFLGLKAKWSHVAQQIDIMESTKVKLDEFLSKMYPSLETDSKTKKTFDDKRISAICTRVLTERYRTKRPDLKNDMMCSGWEAFNAVQGYIQHEQRRRGNVSWFERVIAASAQPEIARAEELVLSLTA